MTTHARGKVDGLAGGNARAGSLVSELTLVRSEHAMLDTCTCVASQRRPDPLHSTCVPEVPMRLPLPALLSALSLFAMSAHALDCAKTDINVEHKNACSAPRKTSARPTVARCCW